jgi:hypothetical protein
MEEGEEEVRKRTILIMIMMRTSQETMRRMVEVRLLILQC